MLHRSLLLGPMRAWLGTVFIALFLAACGGGGGSAGVTGGGSLQPALPPLQGSWQLTVTPPSGVTSAAVTVTASEVPTSTSQLDPAAVARLVARTRFQAYATSVNGSSLRVTDPDTDYLMTINSVSIVGFEGCGTCVVGTDVAFTVNVDFIESGVFDGVSLPLRAASVELRVRYLRTG